MRPLVQVVHDCQLEDLGARGAFYTWTNKHEYGTKMYSRLDRVLVNADWVDMFPDSYVHFLPEGLFDHCPGLIQFEGEMPMRGTPRYRIVQKLKGLKADLRKLNKEQFGDIENLTHVAELSLSQFQTMLVHDPLNEDLCLSKKECSKDLEELRKSRDPFLRQKPKCEWMKHGDDNTAFFHANIKRKRARNEEVSSINQRVVKAGQCLKKEHCDILNATVTAKEIKEAMFAIPGTKAPGPDECNN
ncbi:uncharacterized protein LOC141595792 [Silene latifolia]|uniref:uncharacterized protein LOC141595792 n=1 Tax=Silene latifolia TaxID=37657 RepID=UPI003D76D4FC